MFELFTPNDYFTIINLNQSRSYNSPPPCSSPPHYNSPPPLTLASPPSLSSAIFGCCREAHSILEVMLDKLETLDMLKMLEILEIKKNIRRVSQADTLYQI